MKNRDSMQFLASRGIDAAPEELNRYLTEAVATLKTLVVRPPAQELTAAEQAVLKEGGLDLDPRPAGDDPLAHTVATYAALLETALSAKKVARILDRAESRVRQRLLDRTIYGIRHDRGWVLPLFQFDVRERRGQSEPVGLVPGIDRVFPLLDPELHPVSVYNWFTQPSDELWDEKGVRPLSPRDWLLAGNPVDPVAALAADL